MSSKIICQIARSLSCNSELNKKALKIKKSWNEVQGILHAISPCKKDCDKNCNNNYYRRKH